MQRKPPPDCPFLIEIEVERRPGNALNVEIGAPCARCKLKPPSHWKKTTNSDMSARWLMSGGSPLVFGNCSTNCPENRY